MDDVNPEVFMAYLIQFVKFVTFHVNQSFTNSTLTCDMRRVMFSSNFIITCTAQKPRIWSHLLKKSLMENFIFCATFGSKAKSVMHFTPTLESFAFLQGDLSFSTSTKFSEKLAFLTP